ncbi:glycogen synthase kinase-3 alpha-like [Paramacrobiotus metropolitanus]|uniref:glycogen synthase kinase-3 alpha-like n=1 Tax=Paramacrobiotus metropolitanus TaxID=2943436 RepID=UPI002445B35B|nr:glycogen synthase kinase-3 alpha-like [Paramacrobiotus metropolitanus]XP_055345013.1 glycogen synthase kinase-3 alpha-like [Paramacrobiotus metropolitanus]
MKMAVELEVEHEIFGSGLEYHYDATNYIARGTFGLVYKATITERHDYIGEAIVAVKVIQLRSDSAVFENRDKWMRWRTRLQSLLSLGHEYLVPYHQISIIQEPRRMPVVTIVMDYYCGGDLASLIRQLNRDATPLDYLTAIGYALEIADGLSYLHRRGIIHGDMKPGNILIKNLRNGQKKVSIADLDDLVQMQDSVTCSGDISHLRGTVRYMSPEMLRKFAAASDVQENTPGRKTDVWSLGCIMLELGDCVFPAASRKKQLYRENSNSTIKETVEAGHEIADTRFMHLVIEGYIPLVAESIPPDFAQCIRRCLCRNTGIRISSIQLLQELCSVERRLLSEAEHERHATGVFHFNRDLNQSNQFDAVLIRFDPKTFTVKSSPLPENVRGKRLLCAFPGPEKTVVLQVKEKADTVRQTSLYLWDPGKNSVCRVRLTVRVNLPVTVENKIFFWRYDPVVFRAIDIPDGNLLTKLAPQRIKKVENGTRLEEKLFFIGFERRNRWTMFVECYDTVGDRWETFPDFPGRRQDFAVGRREEFAMVALREYVYVLGGRAINRNNSRSEGALSSCFRLNVITRQWEPVQPFVQPRRKHCAFVWGDCIYIVGGVNTRGSYENSVEVHNTTRGTPWRPTAFAVGDETVDGVMSSLSRRTYIGTTSAPLL